VKNAESFESELTSSRVMIVFEVLNCIGYIPREKDTKQRQKQRVTSRDIVNPAEVRFLWHVWSRRAGVEERNHLN
jgi:hypothetical protein